MSNPDWPGPNWHEQQDDAGSGWRGRQNGLPQDPSPWDDAAGFWRADQRSGRAAGPDQARGGRRLSRHSAAGLGDGRGNRARADDAPRRGRADYAAGQERNGSRFSQTADDLRSRLGLGGMAAGRGRSRATGPEDDADRWGEEGRRPGRTSGRTQAWQDAEVGRGAYRGSRRAGASAAFGDERGGRTALTAVRDRGSRDASGWGPEYEQQRGRRSGRRGGNGGGWDGGNGRFNADSEPLSRGQRFKRWLLHGSWWRHWTWKKVLGVLGGGFAAIVLLGILAFFIAYRMTPIPTATQLTAKWQSSTVYFSNGKQLGTFNLSINGVNVDRQLLTDNQIPVVMTQAMTAAEDRHFYTEGGISVTGLLRATYQNLFGSGNLQGGSTITMQYAKNYYSGVNTGQNLTTKIKEIFIAMKLGHTKSKSWVMTNYLNTVPFGPTTYGLGAAAENYFNVNLTQPHATLTISQAAMLAAMPNSPGFLNPDPTAGAGYTALKARWTYVLGNMVKDGSITQAQMDAQVFPKYNPPPAGNGQTGYTGYLMDMVKQQLEAPVAVGGYGLTDQQINTGGYKITTTFSMEKVNSLARSVQREIAAMKAAGLPFHLYDRIGAVLEDAKTGGIVAIYGGPGFGSAHCGATNCYYNTAEAAEPVGSSFKPYVLSAAVNSGMDVFKSKLNGYAPIWIPLGSSGQMTLSRLSPPPSNYFNSVYWFPFLNKGENFGKPLAVNVAAALSSDSAFEDLLHRTGIDTVINMARQFGVGQTPFVLPCEVPGSWNGNLPQTIQLCNDMTGPGFKNSYGWHSGNGMQNNFSPSSKDQGAAQAGTLGSPAMALGENPLTPVEQASTFATLADHGIYHTPHVIQVLQQGSTTIPSHVITRQVLTPAAAANVDWALSFDNNMSGATAEGNVPFRRGDVIAKTGTLGSGANSSQAWFVGATPEQYALSVALFTNNPGTENLNNLPYAGGTPGSQGGGWPATIWNDFMTAEFSNTPAVQLFPTTPGYPFVPWIQVQQQQPKTRTCQSGHGNGNGNGNGKSCKGNGGGPNPTPSCQFQQCGNPSPTPTCQGPPGLCNKSSPPPSPTPTASATASPSPSVSPSHGGGGVQSTAVSSSPAGSALMAASALAGAVGSLVAGG